jgi:hypothetical protein
VIGDTLSLNGEPYEIVGVMPPGFRFAVFPPPGAPEEEPVWLPPGLRVEELDARADGQDLLQVGLDLFRVVLGGEGQALGDAAAVGVDGDRRPAEGDR